MRKPFIVANWKMHKTIEESITFAKQLVEKYPGITEKNIIIAPPFTSVYSVSQILKDSSIDVSAQTMHWDEKGAYTGEISAPMLVNAGCKYVIIGHSERRNLFGEDNVIINKKIQTALKFGLKTIFCIGESLAERNSGKAFYIIERQIKEGLNNISSNDIGNIIIAYEPVWAIGTGRNATPNQAEEAHCFIRNLIGDIINQKSAAELNIVYGGSVNTENISEIMAQSDINGALIGGASLKIGSFSKIIEF